jgi:hypothetical protein
MADRRSKENPLVTPPSADELAVLEHPRVRAMQRPASSAPTTLVLEPSAPPPLAPSRFLYAKTNSDVRADLGAQWFDLPTEPGVGRGCGFGRLTRRPSAFQHLPHPAKQPQLWTTHCCLVVSPQVRDIFCSYDAAAVEFCEVDWQYADGTQLAGYGLLDIVNLLPAYDYARSRIDVSLYANDTKWVAICRPPIVIRDAIAAHVHFFREERWRQMYFSRELAALLAPLAGEGLSFVDPLDDGIVRFGEVSTAAPARTAPPPAIVHALPSAAQHTGAGLRRRLAEILSLRELGEFAAAESELAQCMRALPESPLHAAIAPRTRITTRPAEVARYLQAFVDEAGAQYAVKALYAEMNAFTVNPDRWFFDLFAFAEDGGRESYAWLGSFCASTHRSCVIEGIEPLQAVYAERDARGYTFFKGHNDAELIAEALVIVRFQRLLHEALAMAEIDVPLLATAHDCESYIVEIAPRRFTTR